MRQIMTKNNIKFLCLVILGFSFYYLSSMDFIIRHEDVHKAIYDFDGIASFIEIDYLKMEGRTITLEKNKCDDTCHMLQMQNEIVGYNVNSIVFNMWCIMAFIIFAYFMYGENRI